MAGFASTFLGALEIGGGVFSLISGAVSCCSSDMAGFSTIFRSRFGGLVVITESIPDGVVTGCSKSPFKARFQAVGNEDVENRTGLPPLVCAAPPVTT